MHQGAGAQPCLPPYRGVSDPPSLDDQHSFSQPTFGLQHQHSTRLSHWQQSDALASRLQVKLTSMPSDQGQTPRQLADTDAPATHFQGAKV